MATVQAAEGDEPGRSDTLRIMERKRAELEARVAAARGSDKAGHRMLLAWGL